MAAISTPFSTSQSRIIRNEANIVLNVRVCDLRPRLAPGVRTQTVTESFPTSSPATRSYMTSMATPFPAARRSRGDGSRPEGPSARDTDPRARSNISAATEEPRAKHLYGLNPHQCVPDVAGRHPTPILIPQPSDLEESQASTPLADALTGNYSSDRDD